jgi:hypothetical protein
MKTFVFDANENIWRVITEEGEAFGTNLSPAQFYAKEVNELHNLLLEDLLRRKNYLSLGEVALWVEDANYGEEAIQIINWFKSTYQLIVAHLETITEYKDPNIFINKIDILN